MAGCFPERTSFSGWLVPSVSRLRANRCSIFTRPALSGHVCTTYGALFSFHCAHYLSQVALMACFTLLPTYCRKRGQAVAILFWREA
jgi:hypothetical protein